MTFTDALKLDELLLVDRLTEHLERGVNQDALDATRRLSTAIEPGQPLAALAHALLALGEQGSRSLQGLVKLDSCRINSRCSYGASARHDSIATNYARVR